MKKFKLVLLTVVLGLLLCSCGEPETRTLSDLETEVLLQYSGVQEVDIQTWRSYNAAQTANSYIIDTIVAIIDNPRLYEADFNEFTYGEVEEHVLQNSGFEVDGYAFANAVDNFSKGLAETGAIISKGDPVVTVDGNKIIVDIECACDVRYADAEFIFNNDISDMVLTSAAFNPRYTTAEKMSKAGLNTVIGMGTVFVMLIVISFIISLFGIFSGAGKKKDKTEDGIDRAVKQIEKNETAEMGDAQLVAVIAAAIAAYEGTTSTDGFVVRSIRKIKRQ